MTKLWTSGIKNVISAGYVEIALCCRYPLRKIREANAEWRNIPVLYDQVYDHVIYRLSFVCAFVNP